MQKLLTGLAAGAALSLLGSAAFADCYEGHGVTAMSTPQEVVAVSTHDEAPPPVVETADEAIAAAPQACADGDADCVPNSK